MNSSIPIFGLALLLITPIARADSWSVTSPNGLVNVAIQLGEPAAGRDYPAGKSRLYYHVDHGPAGGRSTVLAESPLGLRLRDADFLDGLQFVAANEPSPIEERYTMPHGKRRECHNRAQARTLTFRNAAGQLLELDVRAYDDGAAYRYRLPGSGATPRVLEAEESGFALPADARVWVAPADKATTYSPAYETYYENEAAAGAPASIGLGWTFPLLYRTADAKHWALITEAAVGPNFCGSRLANDAPDGLYRIRLPDPAEGNGTGDAHPASTLPWEMPWRLVLVGDSLAPIVESTLVQDVNPPSRVTDASWVKPGRVAWSWWSDNPSPQDAAKQKKFVDLAVAMGWEYVLVDANWTIIDNGTIHDVLRYAKEKNVGILLWYNSGGPHNVVTEKPRDCLTAEPVRRFELELLHKWGVKGIKVDFFQSDKQNVIGLYQDLLRDAADFQIMLNFHGCTLPRGWARTWPHLMSTEAIRGEECYIFDPAFPERAPVQNTITPFTRNVVGPMDYTPVGLSDNRYPHLTTSAHELALAALFETGWLHFADKPEAYLNLPAAPKEFLKQVPVAWDDTRFVAGHPGQFVILARRHGDTWYVVGVNGEAKPREQRVTLGPWLGQGAFEVNVIGDGVEPRTFATTRQALPASHEFTVKMLPRGGFVATVKAGP